MTAKSSLLLDSHIIIWWLLDSPKLTKIVRQLISTNEITSYVSVASIWEFSIKSALGKLTIRKNYLQLLEDHGFIVLDITAKHAQAVAKLPLHHHDPFDRLLIAQALEDNLTLVSTDKQIAKYNVPLIS